MTIALINNIPAVSLAKNPIAVKLQTDAFISSAGTKCTVILDFNSGEASQSETFTFNYTKISDEQLFTFRNAPNNSGLQLPAFVSGDKHEWLDSIVLYLYKNYYLKRDWTIERVDETISMEAKFAGTEYNVTGVNNVVNMLYVVNNGTDTVVEDNFSIVLDIFMDGEQISSQNIVPDNDQYAVFQIAEIILSQIAGHFPSYLLNAPQKATGVYKAFKLVWCEYYGDPPAYKGVTESSEYIAVRGGLSFNDFPNSNYWTTWLPTNKRFMTWKEITRRITQAQSEFLNFLNHSATATSLILKCKMNYSDGSDSTATIYTEATIAQEEIWCFPAGYTQIGVEAKKTAGKTVSNYQLWVEDQASNVISEVITFVIDIRTYENERVFYFENSLGGIDSLRATGKRQDSISIERSLTEKILSDYWESDEAFRQIENYDNSYVLEYAISSGFKEKKAVISQMIELLISRDVREYRNSKLIPVIINKDSFTLYKDNDDQYFLSFEYSDAFSNKAYSEI